MTFSWISEQTILQTTQWGDALRNFYPQFVTQWEDPNLHMRAHREIWNYIEAFEALDLKEILKGQHLRILDLGCGTGWASALLSKYPSVQSIHAVDSDKRLLDDLLPEVVRLIGGHAEKITPIHGFFHPLPVDDATYDVIVSSSALHHSRDIIATLQEIKRALKPNGTLLVVNETPLSYQEWVERLSANLNDCAARVSTASFKEYEKMFSLTGILDDPYLGDLIFSHKHWEWFFSRAGLSAKSLNTGIFPYKATFRPIDSQGPPLHHFVCTKGSEVPAFNSESDERILAMVRPYTMTPDIRLLNTLSAVDHVEKNNIAGAFVECGVWRGGNTMAAALGFLRRGSWNRELYLYDTFDGMTAPTAVDTDTSGKPAAEYLRETAKNKDNHYWAYCPLDDVKANMTVTGYPEEKVHFVVGPVEETIPNTLPDKIAVLRLDTDWYSSTIHELVHLYPRLSPGGILILDDYGTWDGARKAVDEYFSKLAEPPTLESIDGMAMTCVKPY